MVAQSQNHQESGPPPVTAQRQQAHASLPAPESLARPGDTPRELLPRLLRAHLAELRTHAPVARLGRDDEGVHQLRVSVRRLTLLLRVYAPWLPSGPREELTAALAWLDDALAPVRDLDVQRRLLRAAAADLRAAEVPVLERLVGTLTRHRSRARKPLLAALDDQRFTGLCTALEHLAAELGTWSPAPAGFDGAAAALALELLADAWRITRHRADRALARPSARRLHKLRIAARRLRYLAEWQGGLTATGLDEFLVPWRELQAHLGRHQDAAMLRDTLAEASPTGVDGELWEGLRECLKRDQKRLQKRLVRKLPDCWRARARRAVMAERLWDPLRRAAGLLPSVDPSLSPDSEANHG